ncbi:MAG: Flp pilus assembly complex ATPase component TadA [Candidatus Omnitrophica bacterium]|nr:Flp pilus assembly complex ATPase component TadA [Candidatus Omnitrophota bacterium]
MTKFDTLLYETLINQERFKKDTLQPYLKEAEQMNQPLASVLIRHNLLPEVEILHIFSEQLKIPFIDLKNISIEKSVIDKVPVKVAFYYKFIPLQIKERTLIIAVSLPLDIKVQDEIRTQLGYDIELVLASSADIRDSLTKYYGLAQETLEKIIERIPFAETSNLSLEKIEDIERLAEDASVIKLVNQIILEAYRKRATDIHIEPYRQGVVIRYRIDGVLYDTNVPTEIKNLLGAIISRIKIMSNLNIVERRLPQDGRAVVKVQEQILDLRISTLPTPFGESVVIRILPTQMLFSLERLGLSKQDLQILENLIKKPHGIIFVTGPTGSGKTTTLYACLAKINTKERKIITIEDPIEYEMPGITQIQVNPEIGLDFARGLRSALRHDPDVMMVGEARDLETAETAIRVALTGHLVFSTLHTNDASSGITRLLDIGIEPYLVASSVEAFIAQRLIRLICPECKYEDKAAPQELKIMIAKDLGIKSLEEVRIYRGRGCPNCNFTGFFGRTGIYEILLVDETIKDSILKKTPSNQIKKSAISEGMHTLRQDGWQKVIAGITPPEEVMKVTPQEEEVEKATSVYYPGVSSAGRELEKRIYKRLDSRILISYRIFKAQEELIKRGVSSEQISITKNISAGGLLFISPEALPVGEVLELKIELPDGESPVDCLARVVRTEMTRDDKYEIGVCFLDITGAQRSRLDRYVEAEVR